MVTYMVEAWDGHEFSSMHNIESVDKAKQVAYRFLEWRPSDIVAIFAIKDGKPLKLGHISEDDPKFWF